ncbi:CYTH domain-containing protein [Jeotgalibacillus proteolyticus]|uniref:CYTH domain-containing protein n=1 Tax=Jeotgalibacillus proteolyticus TaxID=2082395 RepID=A0A2S5GGZ4_9BACL|nr:CYTH domain-containing protein [Jeotgalibacillus proteolyticus]PPA72320.1 CYTH domain-containing protein [Jeotgalibacillus proteolyticus]
MSQEIEIEFKNLLTKEQYFELFKAFRCDDKEVMTQENHYFDTPSFHLKGLRSALRIREKNGRHQLTLKQPVEEGILETHQTLEQDTAEKMLNGGTLVRGEIYDILTSLKVPAEKIVHFGSLSTNRIEFPYQQGLLVLDHSRYLSKEDYELEYEAASFSEGLKVFKKLLSSYKIDEQKADSKIERFYTEKMCQLNQ